MIRTFESILAGASFVLAVAGGLGAIAMMVHIVSDVVAKYAFNLPIEGTIEVVSNYYMVLVVFTPMAMVELYKENINVDLFFNMLPAVLKTPVRLLSSGVALLLFAILTYQTLIDAMNAYRVQEVIMGSIYVTIWPAKWILPVSFTLTCGVLLLDMVRLITGEGTEQGPPDNSVLVD